VVGVEIYTGSENFRKNVIVLMSIGEETAEIDPLLIAICAKEEVVAVLAHPAVVHDLHLAAEALVALVHLHLGLEDDLQLVGGLVAFVGVEVGPRRPLEVAFLA
jgi:hypothetical protein